MRNSNEAIDRVLAGLRDAEPSTDMEARILSAMRERSASLSERRGGPLSWLDGTRGWMAVAAGMVLVAAISLSVALKEHRAGGGRSQEKRAERAPQVVTEGKADAIPVPVPVRVVVKARPVGMKRVGLAQEPQRRMADDVDIPAPEAPLTEQERLLVRLVHGADPGEIAVLNPTVWAARDEAEKKSVERFFEPLWMETSK